MIHDLKLEDLAKFGSEISLAVLNAIRVSDLQFSHFKNENKNTDTTYIRVVMRKVLYKS